MMKSVATRARLLGSAALGLGLTLVAAQPAQAQCVVAVGSVTCATTATTDTTNAGGTPASDRHYPVDTSAAAFTGTVSAGATVSGFGLSFTNTVGGANALNVVNNGTVQLNALNTATQGGPAALQVTATGATNVNYSGTGSIISLGNGNGLGFALNGTGNLIATVGGNVTSGAGNNNVSGDGIYVLHSGTAGNVAVTTATATTVRADWVGIFLEGVNAANTGNFALTNNATIASLTGAPGTLDFGLYIQNSGLGSASLVNNGAIGSATDRVGVGIGVDIFNAASTAALSVTGSGAIFATGTGITATKTGAGTTTVNYTGAINTTGATGVDVNATTGATAVTVRVVTAATDAVTVDTTTGNQTITLNGAATGTAGSGLVSTSTTGTRTITIGAAGIVTGGTQAILLNGTGATTITVAAGGIVGALSTGLAINDAGGSNQTITNNGTINGRVTLGAGNDTLTNNNGTLNVQGVLDFGAGTDRLVNAAAGTINVLGNTTLVGLENFGTGTIQANAGRINLSTFTLTGPAIAFTNAGTIDTNGSAGLLGFTSFNNSGTLDLAAGTFTAPAGAFTNSGTIFADEGAATITGQTSFASSGGIDLQDGVVGDVLTINSGFAGSGDSSLSLDVSAAAADLLVINGAASGTTLVNFAPVGSFVVDFDGVMIVDTLTTSANAFTVGSNVASDLLNFNIEQRGQDFFVVIQPNATAFDPIILPNMGLDIWHQSAEIYSNYAAAKRSDLNRGITGLGFWGQAYMGRDRYGENNRTQTLFGADFVVAERVETKRRGIQAGVDYNFGGMVAGVTAGWEKAENERRFSSAGFEARGWNLGLYGIMGSDLGFYAGLLAKYDSVSADASNDGLFDGIDDIDIRSKGVEGEVGFRFGMESTRIDVGGGLAWVSSKVDDFSLAGITFDADRAKSLRGRAGVRLEGGEGWGPFLSAEVLHEFRDDNDLFIRGDGEVDSLEATGRGTWGKFELGYGSRGGPGPLLAAWVMRGDVRGFGAKVGYRFGGSPAVILPPPPLPPVVVEAPPPATQTCADGSVILATDACPPAPEPYVPPAPPPAEPERG